jgi:serine/threonine-protein kinase
MKSEGEGPSSVALRVIIALLASLVVLVVIGVVGIWSLVRQRAAPVANLPVETTSTADTATTTPVTRAPASTIARVRINSDPDGASIREEGVELCSSTPCEIIYKGADADPAREHLLTLTRPGFRTAMRNVKPADSPVSVKLTPAARY